MRRRQFFRGHPLHPERSRTAYDQAKERFFRQEAGLHRLMEDLQDGQALGEVVVVNPFAQTPEEVLGA